MWRPVGTITAGCRPARGAQRAMWHAFGTGDPGYRAVMGAEGAMGRAFGTGDPGCRAVTRAEGAVGRALGTSTVAYGVEGAGRRAAGIRRSYPQARKGAFRPGRHSGTVGACLHRAAA